MCGIAGIVAVAPDAPMAERVGRMLALLAHRGPDDHGIWEKEGVCFGHRRLSIIDLTAAGHQPMVDDERQSVITFNGEIYNFGELRAELATLGVMFCSRTDTEVLLKGYGVWGDAVVHRLKGFFAFALWDGRSRRLFCARDPFGKKPFYYVVQGRRFIFASEVEAVVQGLATRPPVNPHALVHFLWKGYTPRGESIYDGVATLQAGSCLAFDATSGTVRTWEYRPLAFHCATDADRTYAATLEECDGLLTQAVQRRLQSDVPIGVLLSGGVDSSLVTLLAAQVSSQPIHTFTAAFVGDPSDESAEAARVVEQAQTQHVVTPIVMDNIPTMLPKLIAAYGEPFGDESAIPTYALFAAIKPYATVILTGDGGDEVGGGYKDVRLFHWRERTKKFSAARPLLRVLDAQRLLDARRRSLRYLGYVCRAMSANGGTLFTDLIRSGWSVEWRRQWFRPEWWRSTEGDRVEHETMAEFTAAGRVDLERYLTATLERLTQAFLVKIDRASMAHSIEARSPFLDIDLFAMLSRLAVKDLLKGGESKPLLKDLLDRRMGARYARRPKRGFTPPLIRWLRQPEAVAWVESQLTAPGAFVQMLLRPGTVAHLLRRHATGYDETGRIWKLLILNAWHARYLSGHTE